MKPLTPCDDWILGIVHLWIVPASRILFPDGVLDRLEDSLRDCVGHRAKLHGMPPGWFTKSLGWGRRPFGCSTSCVRLRPRVSFLFSSDVELERIKQASKRFFKKELHSVSSFVCYFETMTESEANGGAQNDSKEKKDIM